MYAVIESGGKQHRVSPGGVLHTEKLSGEVGETLRLTGVLLVQDGTALRIGKPYVDGAVVTAVVLEQSRAPKLIVGKKKRRKNYRRRTGHRQPMTVLRIESVTRTGGTDGN